MQADDDKEANAMLYTIGPSSVLDVRGMSPSDARIALFAAFDRLATGETFVLVTAAEPRILLGSLQAERKGLFEWSLLEEEPGSWHVEVAGREALIGSLRRVAEALTWDHDRLGDLERRAFTNLGHGDHEVRRAWRVFHHGLDRHIRFEEELLFPVFEARSGLPHAGPTAVLRSEHREIRRILEEITRGLHTAGDSLQDLRAVLHRVLGEHDRKEERILYPALDRLLSAIEADALVARIQAFPA